MFLTTKMFLTKNIRLASNIAKNNQNISILGEVSNFTIFRDKSSQNLSILITALDKNIPSSKIIYIFPRLGFTLRRVKGFTSISTICSNLHILILTL